MVDAVLTCLARDRLAYSDVLEWSASGDERGVDLARFSYAFPGLRRAPAGVGRDVLALASTLGPATREAAARALRAATSPVVEQVLVGYARDHGGEARAKLYLQLRADAGADGLGLAQRLVGAAAVDSAHLPLHLIGLDVGERGLVGAKLYFEAPSLEHPRLGALGAGLVIHRLRGPDDASARAPAELDVALHEPRPREAARADGLTWGEARAKLEPHPVLDALDALATRFTLRPRRLSCSLVAPRKVTVYYAQDP